MSSTQTGKTTSECAATRIVEAPINYLAERILDSVWYPSDPSRSKMPLRRELVRIEDVRPIVDQCTLDREGFCLVRAPTAVKNFHNREEVTSIYRTEIEDAIKQVTGAKKVIVDDCGVVRLNRQSADGRRCPSPVRRAHVDYSDDTGPQFARNALPPEEQDKWMRGRFAAFNTWRALSPPPQDSPLAVCDARSVDRKDLLVSYYVMCRPRGTEFRLEKNVVMYSQKHRWCYFGGMQPDELLLFRGYDSDPSRFTRVPHTGFDDPSVPPDAAPRESIDIRALAYFGD
jgi:hypothetical protein